MKYIKHIILTALVLLLTAATSAWAMQIYISYPSWPTGTTGVNGNGNLVIEIEGSDSGENLKAKIEDKTGLKLALAYQHLYFNNTEIENNKMLSYYGITSNSVLTLTYDQPYKDGNTWVFTMPAANKLLEVENYNTYTLTLSHNAGHGTVELLRPGSSATVGNAENAFQYCYDCQRHPAYPTVANNGNNNLSGFTNPYVGLNGVGTTNNPSGPWKLEYVGQYSHSEYNFSVSSVRHTYGLNSDEDVPIFLLYQWSSATNQYEPVVYGVACAYSKLDNTHDADHTLLFVAEGHWGCFLTNDEHTENLNITFDEDLSNGLPDFVTAATPSLPEGVTDNGNGTYTVVSGTELTIEAIANSAEHYYFDNWTNEADEVYSGSGVVTPSGTKPATSLLTLTITGDTTVRGNFRIDTYTLRVKPNSISMGHVGIGEAVYTSEYKDTVMTDQQHIDVTAIPEPGYYFVNWTNENGQVVSTSVTLNWMATADTTFTANFAKYAFLEVASNNTDWGTVGKPQVGAGDANHVMTLYDESESTSNHMVPAFTCWFDDLTKSQYVIPASKMADAKGGTITSIKYYLQDPTTWTSDVDVEVYLKEVTYSTLSNMVDKSSCTGVYSGQLHFVNDTLTINFTSPYTYNGGNLLVGLENLTAGGFYCGIQFLGEDAPGASMSGFDDNYQQQDFLPQCTFTYQPAGAKEADGGYYVIPGSVVTVTATPKTDYHFVKWTDEDDNVMGTDAQLTFTITGDTTAMANFQSNSATTYTLTLATNDPAMGTVKIDSAGGSGEKTIIDYNSIESDSCSPCKVCWPGEGSDNLFDGNTSSGKWATDSTVKFVVFHTNTPVQVNGYTLFTGNDNASEHGRNPKSWVLKAKLASTDSWTTVATVTDDHTMQDVNYTPFDFEMDVPGTYQYFRFEVSALRGNGNLMQLGEMQLFNRAISFLDSVSVKDAAANEYYVLPGAKVAVKAIPAAGYQLLKWEDNSTDLHRTVTVTGDTIVLATFGLPTPGVTPEGNLTVFGGRFVSETGEIVATPALAETGEFIDESVVPVPTATTSPATDIMQTSATLNGAVSNPDNVAVTAQGFEWKATTGGTYAQVNATGATMTYSLTGLTANTGYTYRAFVTTASGTNYGDEETFTTPAVGPDYSCAVTTVGNNEIVDQETGHIIKVKDHQNNEYKIVQIGNQCWLAENLRTTTSPRTGTSLIPATNANYTYTGKQARWYNNAPTTYAPMNYGLLYNWNAAVDTFNKNFGETSVNTSDDNAVSVTFTGHRRGICPAGWHLPSDAEWTAMTGYVDSQSEYTCGGNSDNIAKALASTENWETATDDCAVGNTPASNNATGFSAVPAGNHGYFNFGGEDYNAFFWSATQSSYLPNAYGRNLGYSSATVIRSGNYSKFNGHSVRCLRD